MCGLVGMFGSDISSVNTKWFEQALWADQLRGRHSTGVFTVGTKGASYLKQAVDATKFLASDGWSKESKTLHLNKAVIGHNRHATVGAHTTQNAHPFLCENIMLVHNGTLVNQSLLPDSTEFTVDSHNICHSIATKGAEWTIKNLDGAFALIWYDCDDDTLNIIRNSERPLHMIKMEGDLYYLCSEVDMGIWLNNRQTYKEKVDYKLDFKVDHLYKFKLHSKKMNQNVEFLGAVKMETYEPPFNSYNYQDDWYSGYQYGKNRRSAKGVQAATLYNQFGLTCKETIEVWFHKSSKIAGTNTWIAEGITLDGINSYVRHSSQKQIDDGYYYATDLRLHTTWVKGKSVHSIDAAEVEPVDLEDEKEDKQVKKLPAKVEGGDQKKPSAGGRSTDTTSPAETVPWYRGSHISVGEFDRLTKHGCVHCNCNLTVDIAHTIEWVDRDQPLCQDCAESVLDRSDHRHDDGSMLGG